MHKSHGRGFWEINVIYIYYLAKHLSILLSTTLGLSSCLKTGRMRVGLSTEDKISPLNGDQLFHQVATQKSRSYFGRYHFARDGVLVRCTSPIHGMATKEQGLPIWGGRRAVGAALPGRSGSKARKHRARRSCLGLRRNRIAQVLILALFLLAGLYSLVRGDRKKLGFG